MKINVVRMHKDAIIPKFSHVEDAAADIYSSENILIPAHEHIKVKTGITMAIPYPYQGFIWDRSGLASRFGLHILGGVVDSSYRGEIRVIILNTSDEHYFVYKGDRIAQIVFHKTETPEFEEVLELDSTERNENGFGSTGK